MNLCNVIHTMTYFMAYLLHIFSRQENQSHRVNHAAVPDEDLCRLNLRREIMVKHRKYSNTPLGAKGNLFTHDALRSS